MLDLLKRKCTIVPDDVINLNSTIQNNLNHIKSIKEVLGYIDFGCDFDGSGSCISHRERSPSPGEPMCCCFACEETKGYFRSEKDVMAEHDVEEIGAHFDKNGFWRPDVGCVLPRRLRSSICSFYMCYTLKLKNKKLYDVIDRMKCLCESLSYKTIDLYKSTTSKNIDVETIVRKE